MAKTMTMKYFTFRQNNSHGIFRGSKYIIVNAPNAESANLFAEEHTDVYFDFEYEDDCECCGMRWYPQYEDFEGDESPSISYDDEDVLVNHSDWLGLEHVGNSSKETWILYEDYNDPTKVTSGMTVDNWDNWNEAFFQLNELTKAPEGSTIYGAVFDGGPEGYKKITIDMDDLVKQGVGHNESYHWDEVTVDILLKHKQEEYRREEKERKKNRR